MSLEPRLVLFHKQATSARTRCLRFADSLLAFAPLPPGAVLRPASEPQGTLLPHPAASLKQAEEKLGLFAGSLRVEAEFYAEVDTPEGPVTVWLAGFTSMDPPFAAAEAAGGRFVAITEARGLPALELDLARRAYEVLIG